MRRTMFTAIAIAITALGATRSLAQESAPTAAPGIARTPLKMPAGPRPGPEVDRLSYFIGAWSSTGHIRPSALGDGSDVRRRESCGWMPGKFFVGCMAQSETSTGRVQSEAIIGWDPDTKLYSWSIFDSTGRHDTRTGAWENGVWTWSGDMKTGDKTVKTRYVISDATPEGYAVRWETSTDGKEWKPLMDAKFAKSQPPVKATPAESVPTPVVTPGKS